MASDFVVEKNLTVDTAQVILALGLDAIKKGCRVIDMQHVAVIDSSAITVLLAWYRAARDHGLSFHGVSSSLSSLAALYGVDQLLFKAPTHS